MRDSEGLRFVRSTFLGYAHEFVKDIFGESVLVMAAHPDDETAGAGALYRYLRKIVFVHATDGAPKNLADALMHGYKTAPEYANARRRELQEAIGVARADSLFVEWGIPDQEASFHLKRLAITARDFIKQTEPESILTLPYEGGHPDHDAVSFAVHAACALLMREGIKPPPVIEYASYHQANGEMAVSDFLPREGFEPITFLLTEDERKMKKMMLERFRTQARVLAMFMVEHERFRISPPYDFAAPPHEGPLWYERFDWGISGTEWRRLAKEAMAGLGLESRI